MFVILFFYNMVGYLFANYLIISNEDHNFTKGQYIARQLKMIEKMGWKLTKIKNTR